MTEREIYITLAIRNVHGVDQVFGKGLKEKVKYFSHAYKNGDWKFTGHPTYECDHYVGCRQCWDKYMKIFIQNKEDQCNL